MKTLKFSHVPSRSAKRLHHHRQNRLSRSAKRLKDLKRLRDLKDLKIPPGPRPQKDNLSYLKKGVIYILTNPSFPEYVKIGYAANIEHRLHRLNQSETIPFAFRLYAVYDVENTLTDKELHRLIDSLNPDLRSIETFDGKERVKEFYAMSAEDAYSILECIAKISGTENRLKRMKPEGHEVEDKHGAKKAGEETRRSPFRFSQCNIEPGSEITYADDPSIVAKVLDDRHILYNNETTSLSALAGKLKGRDHPAHGPQYFKYNGEILHNLRLKFEKYRNNLPPP